MKENIISVKGKTNIEKGYIWAPYTPITTAVIINGEVVWYRNKWKNLWLKIKLFFKKPQHKKPNFKKFADRYKNKPVNPRFYGNIKIDKL